MPAWNEYGALKTVAVRSPAFAYGSDERIKFQWQALRFKAPPDLAEALKEHRLFVGKLHAAGAKTIFLPGDDALTLDSIYPRDAGLVTPKGLILCRMGRTTRRGEPAVNAGFLKEKGYEILGKIEAPGTLEGGDFIWLDEAAAAVGLGPRTNEAGIEQLKKLLGPGVELQVVPLPPPDHPEDVFHLMSIISPLDKDLAIVCQALTPQTFAEWLGAKGIEFVDVPEAKFDQMACNVLALGPRHVLMPEGLAETKKRLKSAGCKVETYKGAEISLKGDGGPTCLTRPLIRE